MTSQPSTVDDALFWNRETSVPTDFAAREAEEAGSITRTARVISLSKPDDDACSPLHKADPLPKGVQLLRIGANLQDFDNNVMEELKQQQPNVVFVSDLKCRPVLAKLLTELPSIEWVHSRSAGIDFIMSPELSRFNGSVTNAKGMYSSTLAEYTMMACSYFAKDLPRLMKNKQDKNWEKYSILELRGATMGIVGYGDIGRACARLASAYGMKVIALRRHVKKPDPLCSAVYPPSDLNRLFGECDYIVCAAPLTDETRHMIGKAQFDAITTTTKPNHHAVFINVGRGPIVDEAAMIQALQNGQLRGVGLDVFEQEPLPQSSPLWDLPNVLLSPHNMDQTDTFMHESTEFFVTQQLPRFVRQQPLLNPVDAKLGY